MGNSLKYHMHPDEVPYDHGPLEFDPHYGFPEGARKLKVPRVSDAEIESMQPPIEFRNYCLHKVFAFKTCQRDHWPLVYKCNHKLHDLFGCQNEEYKDMLKDYERERRLLQRRKRIMLKQQEMKQNSETLAA